MPSSGLPISNDKLLAYFPFSYVIMENLQHLLIDYSPELPIYFDSFTYTQKENVSGFNK